MPELIRAYSGGSPKEVTGRMITPRGSSFRAASTAEPGKEARTKLAHVGVSLSPSPGSSAKRNCYASSFRARLRATWSLSSRLARAAACATLVTLNGSRTRCTRAASSGEKNPYPTRSPARA